MVPLSRFLAVHLVLLAVPGTAGLGAEPLRPTPSGFPSRAITLIAPANPGGGWDQIARLMQRVLVQEPIVSVPVEVVNRGGAGGTIGLAELVGRHRRDPHVVMICGSVMMGAIVTHNAPFGLTDTIPLAALITEYEVVAVPASSPHRSLADLIEAFREDPSSITWGGGSAGGIDHMLVGLLAQAIGVDPKRINYVAFTGGGEAATAVMGGQVTAGVSGFGEWKGQADAGRMRFLAVSAPRRISGDSTPTLQEAGVDIVLPNWRGIVAPPGLDDASRAWLLEAIERMRATAAWQEILRRNHWEDTPMVGDEFKRFLIAEHARTARTLRELGLGTGGQGYAAVGPWFFPSLIFAAGLLSSVFLVAGRSRSSVSGESEDTADPRKFLLSAGLLLAYVWLLEPVGFPLTTAAYVFLQARAIGSRAWVRDLVASAGLTVAVYLVFKVLLQISLPLGILRP